MGERERGGKRKSELQLHERERNMYLFPKEQNMCIVDDYLSTLFYLPGADSSDEV